MRQTKEAMVWMCAGYASWSLCRGWCTNTLQAYRIFSCTRSETWGATWLSRAITGPCQVWAASRGVLIRECEAIVSTGHTEQKSRLSFASPTPGGELFRSCLLWPLIRDQPAVGSMLCVLCWAPRRGASRRLATEQPPAWRLMTPSRH